MDGLKVEDKFPPILHVVCVGLIKKVSLVSCILYLSFPGGEAAEHSYRWLPVKVTCSYLTRHSSVQPFLLFTWFSDAHRTPNWRSVVIAVVVKAPVPVIPLLL